MILDKVKKQTILFISYGKGIYGANSSLLALSNYLRTNCNINPIFITPFKGDFYEKLNSLNYEVINLPWEGWVHVKSISFVKKLTLILYRRIRNIFFFRKIFEEIRTKNIDLIHTNNSVTDLGLFLSKKLNKPHIWYFREFLEEDYGLTFDLGQKYSNSCISKYSDKIICNSKAVKLKHKKQLTKEPIVIYNGIDPNLFHSKQKVMTTGKIKIAMVGLISEGKNQIEVLKALNFLEVQIIQNLEIHFVGRGNGKTIEELKNYIKENNFAKNIIFHNHLEDIPSFLSEMDFGIISSKNEAFGRVTVEYMLAGLPVIGSDSGGTTEIIKHNVTGYLYEPGNPKDLAGYILEFMKNPEQIRKMGAKAQKEARSAYDLKIYGEKMFKVYKDLLN